MRNNFSALERELMELDRELVTIDGTQLKPSQCYHLETDPAHILFNTNCPDSVKQKVQSILARYLPGYESGSPQ